MDWLDRMNRALDYVEAHLEDKMDYEALAQAACCSAYHFQRMFTFMTDMTLSEYVRRRRMTLAAQALAGSEVKVIDLALRFGYESPEAFTRAFQGLHGISPTLARKSGAQLKAFPRVRFQITVKGVTEMNYRIVSKPAFQLYGVEEVFDTVEDKNLWDIPAFWGRAIGDGTAEKLVQSACYPTRIGAVCCYRKLEAECIPYMLCALKTPLADTEGYTVVDVPASTWAIFKTDPHDIEKTSEEIQALTTHVYTDWLPAAAYELVGGFDMELYHVCCDGNYYEEVWFRVKPKAD